MLTRGIIERFFEAASIQRWNDHVRPVEFTELDKQAHKMVIAYIVARFEESERETDVDWIRLIEGGIFEFLQRVILTDIKPPVFHKMMARKGDELNEWVLRQLGRDLSDLKGGLGDRFREYLFSSDYGRLEKRILKAAHYLATNWEFKIIYNVSPFIYGIGRTKEEIENQIEDHYDLVGVQKISLGKKSYGFIDLCGQLRFQQRWAQSPRVPKTSVLGHMLIVAALSYLCALEMGACRARLRNDFYAGLLHDLPEVLTRDIVSPIKNSVEGLQDIIKEYERIQVEEKLLPLLPSLWHDEIRYFIDDEFENKIRRDGKTDKGLSNSEINERYNEDVFAALDGELIKVCDHLAAFIEASLSIRHGITSRPLAEARHDIRELYEGRMLGSLNVAELFDLFSED